MESVHYEFDGQNISFDTSVNHKTAFCRIVEIAWSTKGCMSCYFIAAGNEKFF